MLMLMLENTKISTTISPSPAPTTRIAWPQDDERIDETQPDLCLTTTKASLHDRTDSTLGYPHSDSLPEQFMRSPFP